MPADHVRDLEGKVFINVQRLNIEGQDSILMIVSDEEAYALSHDQDCCEDVSIEEIIGDLDDMANTPIIEFREDTKEDESPKVNDSGTWTFYNIRTIKGSITIRFYGSSNGYYSESADLVCPRKPEGGWKRYVIERSRPNAR